MSETVNPSYIRRNPLWTTITNRFAPVLVLIFQLLALVALVTVIINAFRYFQTPFIGSFVEHTLVLNAGDSVQPGTWEAKSKGLSFGHQILGIDDKEIISQQALNDTLRTYAIGDVIDLHVINLLSSDPQPFTVQISLQAFPIADQIAQMVIPLIIGLVYLGSGLWVLSLRRYDTTGQVFSTFTASVAITAAGLFEVGTTGQLTGLWTFSLAMAGGTMVHLALLFPQEILPIRKRPFLGWLSYFPTVILLIGAFPTLYNFSEPQAYVLSWRYEYIYIGVAIFFFVGIGIYHRYSAPSPIARQQSQIILLGTIISFTPIAIWFFITATQPLVGFSPFLLFPLAFFPVSVAYAILRYRLLNSDYIFSRAVLYALLTILAVSGYALLVGGLSLIFGDRITADNPVVIGLMVFLLALFLNPLRTKLQNLIDRAFLRGQQVYQEQTEAFSRELNPAMDLISIITLLRKYVTETLAPEQLHIYLRDSLLDLFLPMADESGQPTSDIRFPVNGALPQVLAMEDTLFIKAEDDLPASLESDRVRLALLGAQLFIPLPGRDESVIGFMALTSRKSGEPYTTRDVGLLESFSDQAALAVERAQVVDDLEQRVTEMNVLIRVAQGVNITISFDDILELIYAQTNRLIPARDFWIMLYDSENDLFQYAFYLEDDRRLLQYENRYIFSAQDISQVVVREGRLIVTEDYERECRLRGLKPLIDGLYGWVGVPLNAGAMTIGAMSLGSRDPSVIYSDDQLSMLQAVADQAAGAIIKTRLLEDTERNARQLSLLNEVGRNLTSVLDLPSLLNQILDSAIEILNCEAGTLFLIDEETDELIFEVVKGPVAGELVGRRLPPGTGHVGRAVETGKAATVNEARSTEEWDREADQDTGFKTRDLLLVPMTVKDQVVGVIEVINRKDKMPFTQDDQELLATFTSSSSCCS